MENNHENDELDILNEEAELDELELDLDEEEESNSEPADNTIDWKERALKAEKLIIESKKKAKEKAVAKSTPEVKKKPVSSNNSNPFFEERLELLATGFTREEVDQLTIIAKGAGTSLNDALDNEVFKTWRDKKQEEKREQRAKLGASRGAANNAPKALFRPNMTREEHMEAFKKANGLA